MSSGDLRGTHSKRFKLVICIAKIFLPWKSRRIPDG
jgi:hypothetical protein